jgi:hypothetical protein
MVSMLESLQNDVNDLSDQLTTSNDEVSDLNDKLTTSSDNAKNAHNAITADLTFLKEGFNDIIARLTSIEMSLKKTKPPTPRKKAPPASKEVKTSTPYKSLVSFVKGELVKELLNTTEDRKISNILNDFTVSGCDESILPYVMREYSKKIEGKSEGPVRTAEIAKYVWSTLTKPQKDAFKPHFTEYQNSSLEIPSGSASKDES